MPSGPQESGSSPNRPGGLEDTIRTVENDNAVIFCLDTQLRLVYANRAWDRFAAGNGGENLMLPAPLGRPLLDFISGPLHQFFAETYANLVRVPETWHHTYECSSPQVFRQFAMDVFPFRNGEGLMVVNSLLVERAHDESGRLAMESQYRNESGFVVMCSHCRRTRRAGTMPEQWDWVPDYVANQPVNVSHGLCAVCLDYHYPG